MSSSSRRSRSSPRHNINTKSNGMMGSKISDDEILQLVSKLHHLLPQIGRHSTSTPSNKASANKVLQETCNYIRSLHNEMDDLSARLSQLLSAVDHDSPQAAIIRTLI